MGDQIVLTPTRWDPAEAEVLTVNGVVNEGLTVLLQTRAKFPHFGDLVPLVNGTRQLDVRGEVGLLTHNVVIQGEVPPPELDAPGNNRFGCRVVVSGYAGLNGTLQVGCCPSFPLFAFCFPLSPFRCLGDDAPL